MKNTFSILSIFFILPLIFGQLFAQPIGKNGVQIIESTTTHVTVQVKIDSISIQEKHINQQVFHQISIPDFEFTIEPGKPQLPATGLLLAMPIDGSAEVELIESRYDTRQGIELLPSADAIIDEIGIISSPFGNRSKRTELEGWFPCQPVQLGEPGMIRDQRVLPVQIYPIQYHASEKSIRCYRALQFRIHFSHGSSPQTAGGLQPRFEAALQHLLANYKAGKNWRAPKVRSVTLEKTTSGALAGPAFKIYVYEDGIYRVSRAELDSAGVPVAEIDPRTLRLVNRGTELPIYVHGQKDGRFDPGDYLEFYGEFNRGENSYLSPYSDGNVYWLSWGEQIGRRLAETDVGLYLKNLDPSLSPTAFEFTQHIEQDKVFDRLLLVTDEKQDHWFWETMNALKEYEFKFPLDHPTTTGTARVRVMLHGSTHPDKNPDHHTVVTLNGYLLEDATWDGQVAHEILATIPNAVLIDGENTLRVKLPGDTPAGEVDQVLFNWVEITYWRQFLAKGDFIEIPWASSDRRMYQFNINGFSRPDISIIDNLGRRLVNFDVQKADFGYQVTFQDQPALPGLRYFIYSPGAIKKAGQIVADRPSNLRSPQNGADYILISHERFWDAARSLAEHRRAQNLRVATVDVQDIYDEFNDGIFDPMAIQKFLQYAYENWQPPAPLYVLLVGDATWAYDKPLARSWQRPCFIPSIMKYTYSWGVTSSDNAFVCVSGDDRLPDMFIGRLPVNTGEEAQIVIDKIIQYEKQPMIGDWRKRVCLACGDDPFFEQSADQLYREYIPKSFDVPRLYTNPRSKYFGSTQELVGIFNDGVALLNFIGHGGGGVFFDADLFLLEDIVLLKNARTLPVIFSLTCFIGYFDNPWTPSLGEELLRARDKGCVATFGSAGRAWLYGDYFLNNALFEAMFKNHHRHLGQITTEAKWRMISWTGSYWDHVENYNLLGDPALRIGFPPVPVELHIAPPSVVKGGSVTIQGKLPQPLAGQAKISLVDASDAVLLEQIAQVSAGRFEVSLTVPQSSATGPGLVKAYFWNETSDGIGAADLGVGSPAFSEIGLIPSSPSHRDSIYFLSKIEVAQSIAPLGIDSAICQISYTQTSWENLTMRQLPDGRYQTQRPLVANEGIKIYYRFRADFRSANDSPSNSMTSQVYSFTVNRRADLRFLSPELLVFGRESVLVQTRIFNKGETDARNFIVELFDGDPTHSSNRIGEPIRVERLAAGQDTLLQFAWRGQPRGYHQLLIRIDGEKKVVEFNESNNEFQKSLHLITLTYGSAGPMVSQDRNFTITIPPGSVPLNCSGDIIMINAPEINSRAPMPIGFVLAGPQDSSSCCYELRLDHPEASIMQPFSISFHWPETHWQNLPRVYAWDRDHQHWSRRAAQLDSSAGQLIATALSSDFLFGLFWVTDQTPPQLTVRIENQNFADQDYISSSPIISATIEDESGIDLKSQPPEVYLDNQIVDLADHSLWFSPQSNKMTMMRFSPTLSPGDHVIKIRAADLAGNWSEQPLNVTVSGEFALQAIANHPNPFVSETIIAYTLTDEAERVTLTIHTVSGRLIRRFEFANEVGYVEHIWDGCDEMGEEVANGVYYMRFVAVNGKKRIERVEKVAKLK